MAGGKITAVSSTSITLAGRDGKAQTVKVDGSTKVYAGRDESAISALKVGWLAFVQKNDAGVATVIRAVDPAAIRRHFTHHRFTLPKNVAVGKVTAVSASSITLEARDGKAVTVAVNTSTKVYTRDGEVEVTALKTGWFAFAMRGKDGVATVIRAADPSQFGFHGDHDGDGGDHAPAASNTSL
jgi:hypothetical protein